MVDADLKDLLTVKNVELKQALAERDRQNVRIIQLQNDVQTLYSLIFRDALAKKQHSMVGLSDAIRSVVRLSAKPMTAASVKNTLQLLGFDFSEFSNPSAGVHNTLRRLAGTGELHYSSKSKTYTSAQATRDGLFDKAARGLARVISHNK
jgi:hypothetical protein